MPLSAHTVPSTPRIAVARPVEKRSPSCSTVCLLHGWLTHFENFFQHYGYVAVFLFLLLEDMGVPVPGETVLLYTSFLARQGRGLALAGIIPIGIAAAVLGDNTGFLLTRKGGSKVADFLHLTPKRLSYFNRFFDRYGAWTVCFARFVAGLRVIAGPAAGLSDMNWLRFTMFNAVGAVLWVMCIAFLGFFLGSNWPFLKHWMGRADILLVAALIGAVIYFAWRYKRTHGSAAKEVS